MNRMNSATVGMFATLQGCEYFNSRKEETKGFKLTSTNLKLRQICVHLIGGDTKSGIVVSPGAWMFHKGLTFTRRKNTSKSHKDLYGIWYVATQLGDFSDKAVAELLLLGSQHLKWFKTFQNNLRNWLENASPLEWSKLEAQDPSGKLKKLDFERMTKEILRENR